MPEVVFTYHGQGEGFGPDKKRVAVRLNDTLVFKLHPGTRGAIEGAKLRISFQNPEFFSAGKVAHKDTDKGSESLTVQVVSLPATGATMSFYKCELMDKDVQVPLATLDGASGGEIVPDRGGS